MPRKLVHGPVSFLEDGGGPAWNVFLTVMKSKYPPEVANVVHRSVFWSYVRLKLHGGWRD